MLLGPVALSAVLNQGPPGLSSAVAAVIEAGGGDITDWDGNANDLSWPGRVVAAGDPDRHRDVLVLLSEGA
ncbi:MAG: hypothetical protein O7B98_09590 [Alphaproteobacteria bacterium]|nr:hypothetical protein [Alphaproteobacteria bacterium]